MFVVPCGVGIGRNPDGTVAPRYEVGLVPPHCDSLDGPVVTAAARAFAEGDVALVLPYVPEESEDEVRHDFEEARAVASLGATAKALAEEWLFENVVRLHRAGEGAPYTGLKPVGLDHGPVLPVAERALERASPDELVELLTGMVEEEVRTRFRRVLELRARADGDLHANRECVEATLGLEVWAHALHEALLAEPHEHGHPH